MYNQFHIFIDSIKIVSVICLLAYPLTMRKSLLTMPSPKEKVFLTFIFGGISILGNILGLETFNGALLDSRIVGPVIGGIIAGPYVGIFSGLIGGIHRYTMGGFTVVPALLANIAAGLIGGYVHIKFFKIRTSFLVAFLTGIVAEITHKLLILWLAKPRIVADVVVSMYGPTSVFVNALGIALFLAFVNNIQSNKHIIGANYAEKALDIAKETLAILKNGFNEKSAKAIAEIIYSISRFDAVVITNKKDILAFKGNGCSDHHPRNPIKTSGIHQDGKLNKEVFIISTKEELGCTNKNCPLTTVAIAPLICNKAVVGYINIFRINESINPSDIKLLSGIAELLSLQMENVRLDEQTRLLERAEYSALKSQVNPHFLFNALSVIKLLIRINPKKAQELILNLAGFFRKTLKTSDDILPFSEELNVTKLYLSIQKARFAEKLNIDMNIGEDCFNIPFPTFALQPIVENSMNHGLANHKGLLKLSISAEIKDSHFLVKVKDNGVGIPQDIIDAVRMDKVHETMGIGLTNINRRLKSLYGEDFTFELSNTLEGSLVIIGIPIK